MKRFTMIVLTGLAALTLGACTSQPLVTAQPIAVPSGVTQPQVQRAIDNALDSRGWTIDKTEDGNILSTLHLRDHTATVRITYDTQSVKIAYVSSTNLDYSQRGSRRYIHRNYNGWVGFLEQDIKRNLQNATVAAGH